MRNALVAGSLLLIGVACWFLLGPGYYYEQHRITNRIESLPGVTVLESGGIEDVWLKNIWVEIKVANKGKMRFHNLEGSIRDTAHVYLSTIGSFHIHGEFEGSGKYGYVDASGKTCRTFGSFTCLDFGQNGPFRELLPFALSGLDEAISHYDDLVNVLGKWPHKDAKGHFRDGEGTDFWYWVD